MGQNNTLRNTLIVSAGTLVSRVLGFVRLAATMYVLSKLTNDVFQLANLLPNQIYDLFVSSAFSAILIPAVVRAQKSKQKDAFLSALFVTGFTGLAIVTVIATILAPFLVRIFGYQIPANWTGVGIGLAFLCLPQVFFYGAHSLLGQYLNANNRFAIYAWSPAGNNIVGLIGLAFFHMAYSQASPAGQALLDPNNWDWRALALLGIPTTLGIVVQAALLLPAAWKCGFKLVFPIRIRGLGLGRTLREGLWATCIVGLTQISLVAISNVAGSAFAWSSSHGIEVPSYTERMAASLFYALPFSVLILSVINVLFPRIVSAVTDRDHALVRKLIKDFHYYVGPVCVFSTVVLMSLALPLSQSLTLVSDYNPELVAITLIGMSPSLIPVSITLLNQRILFADGKAKEVFFANIPPVFVNVFFCWLAVQYFPAKWWLFVASLATALANQVLHYCYLYALPQELRIDLKTEMKCYLRPLVGGCLTGLAGVGFLYLVGFYSANFITLALRGFTAVLLESAVFFFFGLDPVLRSKVSQYFKRFIPVSRH